MKVCFITPSFPNMNCGVGDYTSEFISSLLKEGIEVSVIATDHEKIKQFAEENRRNGLSISAVIKRWDLRSLGRVVRKIKESSPDVIHIQYHWWNGNDGLLKGLAMVLLPLALKLCGFKKPIFTTLHSRLNGPYLFPGAGFLRRYALMPLFLFSDWLIVTNRYDAKKIGGWLPVLKKKIIYIAGGTGHYLSSVELKKEAFKLKAELKKRPDEIILCNFGFMIPYKGIEELLKAMRILIDKGYHLNFLGIGGFDIEVNFSGSYFKKLQKMVQDLNLTQAVRWTGYCDARQASVFLLASDICAMPFSDGASEWRSSFLDALSHDLAVVTTFSEKTPPELVDKINCRLIPPHDPARLAEVIEELINSPAQRESLGRAAGELFRKNYHWPVITKKSIECYQGRIPEQEKELR